MAYNLECLVRILEQFLHPDQQRWNIAREKRPQFESLLEKASSLKQKLETCSPASTQNLVSEIRDAAHKAEDIIESHMVDQMLSEPEAMSFTISPPDLEQVIQEFDAAMDKLITHGSQVQMPSATSSPGPGGVSLVIPGPGHPICSKDDVVGLNEDMRHLAHLLTGDQRKLRIIPIIGMGGIGKTTLAQKLYNDHPIVSHFDARAWTTITQKYDVRAILLELLGCIIGKLSDEILREENQELGVRLHKSLFGYRYLFVVDDIWSTNAWDDIKMLFPDGNNGSRIIVTTRELNVAKYVDPSECPWHHQMHLLNKSQSWNLLQQKVFGKDKCPTKLESIGRRITANCRGLPLAIHVVGGLLSKSKGTIDFWEHVLADIGAALSEKDDQFFNVLSLSYNHLPHHLKACFLYMAAFPEDYEIRASRLIKLWVAEGFLKSSGRNNLEEEAEDCLNALAERNLVMVTKHRSNGKAKSCSIHDLLRDLCIRKADQEKFLYIPERQGCKTVTEDLSHCLRRLSLTSSSIYDAEKFMLLARSFLWFVRVQIVKILICACGKYQEIRDEEENLKSCDLCKAKKKYRALCKAKKRSRELCKATKKSRELCKAKKKFKVKYFDSQIQRSQIVYVELKCPVIRVWLLSPIISKLKLLRVLDAIDIQFDTFPGQVLKLVNLHYLAMNFTSALPVGVSRLLNLRTLILGPAVFCSLPIEVLVMPELRYLKFKSREAFLIRYSSGEKVFVNEKLQTVATIYLYPIILESIPNIKKLAIDFCERTREIDLHHLNKLETLKLSSFYTNGVLPPPRFPPSLRKLSLDDCLIPPGFMTTVASSLPNLEVLKICYCHFQRQKNDEEEEWESTEEQIFSLRFLLLENLKLVHWRASETNFPRLQHLVIRRCSDLEEIPEDIGDIQTLELIEADGSSPGVLRSARKIKQKQLKLGNDDIEVLYLPEPQFNRSWLGV